MSFRFKVVVPARYASTRLPGKPLLDIGGKPMIAHVCASAIASNAEQVVVATDHKLIYEAVDALGIKVVMTDSQHQSGTERIAEVADILGWQADEIVVNLQGDEPLMPPHYIRSLAESLANNVHVHVATLAAPILEQSEIFNHNIVKVVLDKDNFALYFSRAAIPWDRANFPEPGDNSEILKSYLRHIGIYAYTVGFLQKYCNWLPSPLEKIEALEQLRILWQGEKILVHTVLNAPEAGVDTEADLMRIRAMIASIKTI